MPPRQQPTRQVYLNRSNVLVFDDSMRVETGCRASLNALHPVAMLQMLVDGVAVRPCCCGRYPADTIGCGPFVVSIERHVFWIYCPLLHR